MSSRGFYIGDLVDELAGIRARVEERGKLGLFDLHRNIEDFIKTILNEIYEYKLENANTNRSNEPGVDLIDKVNRLAIQVTADNKKSKIETTIKKFEEHHKTDYDKLIVFIVGTRKKEYTIDEPSFPFSVDNDIWDINHLLRNAIILDIDKVKTIYDFVKRETARIKIELELPDFEGKYPTTIADFIEKIPKPQLGSLANVYKYYEEHEGSIPDSRKKEINSSFLSLFSNLQKLPRITRELYAELFDFLEDDSSERLEINYERIKRMVRTDIDPELRLLEYYEVISLNPPEDHGEHFMIRIRQNFKQDNFITNLIDISKENKLNLKQSIKTLDFSSF